MTQPIGPTTTSSDWTRRLASLVAAIRPDWDEQKAATTELAALRDCITAILSEQ